MSSFVGVEMFFFSISQSKESAFWGILAFLYPMITCLYVVACGRTLTPDSPWRDHMFRKWFSARRASDRETYSGVVIALITMSNSWTSGWTPLRLVFKYSFTMRFKSASASLTFPFRANAEIIVVYLQWNVKVIRWVKLHFVFNQDRYIVTYLHSIRKGGIFFQTSHPVETI